METLRQSHDVTLHWRSFELRPAGAPPIAPEYRARIEAGRPRLNAIAEEHYGLNINPGPFGIDSRSALVGAKYAEAAGVGDAYHRAVFDAYWRDGRDIGDIATLADIAHTVGLDPDDYRRALSDAQWQTAVTADVEQAHAYGLSGVPALIFADQFLVSGAQPYETLARITGDIAAQLKTNDNDPMQGENP